MKALGSPAAVRERKVHAPSAPVAPSMRLRAWWYQAGGLLALAIVFLANAELRPLSECDGETGIQPGVCIPYGTPHAVPSLFLGLAALAGALVMLWVTAGRWRPDHAVALRFLMLLALGSVLLVVAAWGTGIDSRCAVSEGAAVFCVPDTPDWVIAAYLLGGIGLGMAAATTAILAFLTTPADQPRL